MILNLTQTYFDRNINRGSKTAYIDDSQSITYSDLETQTRKVSTWLTDHGVVAGDRINLILLDRIDTVIVFLATTLIGATAVVCNPRTKTETLKYQADFIKPKLIITEPHLKENFDTSCYDYSDILAECQTLAPWSEPVTSQSTDVAFMLWTSGTTGRTKAVMHTHANALANNQLLSSVIPQTSEDRVYSTAKLFFTYGIAVALFHTLWHGSTGRLDSGLVTPNKVKKIIDEFRPTLFYSVPVIYSQVAGISDHIDIKANCICAGDALPEPLIARWQSATGQAIHNLFGSTELLSLAIFNQHGTSALGQAVPGAKVRVVDEAGNEVEKNQPGMLQIKLPSIGIGYYNDQEWTEKTFRDYIITGDLVYQDTDLNFHYIGRASDAIKINGIYVNPSRIEESLQTFPGIEQAAVVAKKGIDDILQIEAFIVANTQLDLSGLKSWILKKHEKSECPRVFHVVDNLPRTDTGKIQRYLLR